MVLLERADLLQGLSRHLEDAASAVGRVVFVAGEAGIGKTSLVRAFLDTAEAARVLLGACDPLTTPRPLGPLLDMLPELGPGLEELVASGAPRDRIFRAFLRDVADGPRPTLVVVEDVHWADDATLDLLRFFGRRIEAHGVLLVATYRDDEVGPAHALRTVLGDLAAMSWTRRMRVGPLSAEAVATLADDQTLPVDADRLYRQTGGNPFYVTEILASGSSGVPEGVVDAVLARASRLGPRARATLDAAAVIGARLDSDVVASVASVDADAVDACVGSGMLQTTATGLAFRHELTREALLQALPSARKRALHRKILAVLESGPPGTVAPDLATLAHHAEGAQDAAAVLRYAPAAALEAQRAQAHREAASQYARALRFAKRLPARERAGLLEAHARECHVTEQLEEAVGAYRAAISLRREVQDVDRVARDLAEMSRTLVVMGRNDESDRAASEALGIAADASDDAVRAFAHLNWAYLRMLNRDNDDAREGAERALRFAPAADDVGFAAQARNVLGCVLILTGRENEGIAALEDSRDLALDAGLDGLAASAMGNLGSALGEVHRFEAADRYLNAGIAFSRERDLDFQRLYMLAWRALSHAFQGRWVDATADAGAVLRRPGSAAISRMMALVALGRVRARRGDPEAWEALDEALSLAEASQTLQRLGPVRAARAEAAWLAGDRTRAVAEAEAAFGLALAKGHPWFVGELAYWLWKAGARTEVPAATAEPYARQMSGAWRGAADAWRERSCPYEQARALAESADPDGRVEAAAILTRLGARPALQELARRTDAVTVPPERRGPRASTAANPAGLTNRQLDVLELLAAGLTNAEIAERLVRAEKTVEHHVSAILGKLEVRNRTEAAQRATALGVGDQNREDEGAI